MSAESSFGNLVPHRARGLIMECDRCRRRRCRRGGPNQASGGPSLISIVRVIVTSISNRLRCKTQCHRCGWVGDALLSDLGCSFLLDWKTNDITIAFWAGGKAFSSLS